MFAHRALLNKVQILLHHQLLQHGACLPEDESARMGSSKGGVLSYKCTTSVLHQCYINRGVRRKFNRNKRFGNLVDPIHHRCNRQAPRCSFH